MVSEKMTSVDDLLANFRMPGHIFTYTEKRGQGIVFFQFIQHIISKPRNGTVIKSEVNDFLVCLNFPGQARSKQPKYLWSFINGDQLEDL